MSTDDRSPLPTATDETSPANAGGTSVVDPRFTLGPVLGRGGMGEVRLAHDEHVDRDVAIKLMHGADETAAARFLFEARVQGRLEHPAIVPVYDLGTTANNTPYLVMKRLTGKTLHDIIKDRAARQPDALVKWPRRILLARFVEVCLAVEFAHTRGVIHRDLKPTNIMLGDFGETHVLDWGIAKIAESALIAATDLGRPSGPIEGPETVAGSTYGTPGYMPPEQIRGETVDARADVFALGCVLFEILAEEPALPRGLPAFEATLRGIVHRPAERAPGAEIPPELDDACARATAPETADRFPSARALAAAVQAYLDGDRDLERRKELAAEHAEIALATDRADETGRATAMREAARALALDGTNEDAQKLLAELLLRPPEQIPAKVAAELDAEHTRVTARHLRIASKMMAALVACVALLFVVRVNAVWPVATLCAMLSVGAIGVALVARRERFDGKFLPAILLFEAGLVVITGIIIGPFHVIPVFVFGSSIVFLTQPSIYRPVLVIVSHVIMAALPLILELTHITPQTFRYDHGAFIIESGVIELTELGATVSVVVLQSVLLVGIGLIIMRQRQALKADHERVHLLGWHYRQLVPTSVHLSGERRV